MSGFAQNRKIMLNDVVQFAEALRHDRPHRPNRGVVTEAEMKWADRFRSGRVVKLGGQGRTESQLP